MEPELEKYFNVYFDLFNTEGWKQLTEEFRNNGNVINSVESTKDVDDMYFRKGQLNVIAHLVNLEGSVEQAYTEAKESNEDD
jgi:hypothetical protein|tara:strand:+ start:244 stop:489 length:246 start_codon:yes stop_codon:yes gene_type:complete